MDTVLNRTVSGLTVTPGIPWWAIVLLAAAAAAGAYWFYRRTVPPLAGWRRAGMILLRAAALLLLIAALADPLVRISFTETRREAVAVLLDTSGSMATPRDPGRETDARNALGAVTQHFPRNHRLIGFDSEVRPLAGEPAFTGDATDIAAALAALAGERELAGVVLISDGRCTIGADPAEVAAPGIPVYTVLTGSGDLPFDLAVESIAAPPAGRAGDTVDVSVTVVSAGRLTGTVPVRIMQGSRVAASAEAVFDDARRAQVRLALPLETPGRAAFEAVLGGDASSPAPPADTIVENDRRAFGITVLKSTYTVLLLADLPSPDAAFIRRELERTGTFAVSAVFASGIALAGERAFPADLSTFDAVVIVDGGGLSPSGTEAGALAVRIRAGMGAWFTGELPNSGPLAGVLPLEPSGADARTGSFILALTVDGRGHPATAGTEALEAEAWPALPPIPVLYPTGGVREGARVLAVAGSAGAAETAPALAAGTAGAGKVLCLPMSGFWRWHLRMEGAGRGGLFGDFVESTMRWLAAGADVPPLSLTAGRETWLAGERIEIEARLHDSVWRPVSGADIRVVVDDDPELTVFLDETAPAVYTGTLPPLPPGTHICRAAAAWGGVQYAAADTVVVAPLSLEQVTVSPDPDLLAAIASRTGGIAVTAAGIDSVLALIEPQTVAERRDTEHRPARGMVPPAAVIILLAAEWAIRRRRGML